MSKIVFFVAMATVSLANVHGASVEQGAPIETRQWPWFRPAPAPAPAAGPACPSVTTEEFVRGGVRTRVPQRCTCGQPMFAGMAPEWCVAGNICLVTSRMPGSGSGICCNWAGDATTTAPTTMAPTTAAHP